MSLHLKKYVEQAAPVLAPFVPKATVSRVVAQVSRPITVNGRAVGMVIPSAANTRAVLKTVETTNKNIVTASLTGLKRIETPLRKAGQSSLDKASQMLRHPLDIKKNLTLAGRAGQEGVKGALGGVKAYAGSTGNIVAGSMSDLGAKQAVVQPMRSTIVPVLATWGLVKGIQTIAALGGGAAASAGGSSTEIIGPYSEGGSEVIGGFTPIGDGGQVIGEFTPIDGGEDFTYQVPENTGAAGGGNSFIEALENGATKVGGTVGGAAVTAGVKSVFGGGNSATIGPTTEGAPATGPEDGLESMPVAIIGAVAAVFLLIK